MPTLRINNKRKHLHYDISRTNDTHTHIQLWLCAQLSTNWNEFCRILYGAMLQESHFCRNAERKNRKFLGNGTGGRRKVFHLHLLVFIFFFQIRLNASNVHPLTHLFHFGLYILLRRVLIAMSRSIQLFAWWIRRIISGAFGLVKNVGKEHFQNNSANITLSPIHSWVS